MGTDDLFKKRKAGRKARKAGSRAPTAGSFLIVAEGEKTEPLYFEALRHRIIDKLGGNIEIKVHGEGRSTVSLVEKASEIVSRSSRVYEHVWVVFDKDDFDDFDEAIELVESRGFEVAWTNQAFEFWLFLHFGYSDAALNRRDWCRKLSEVFRARNIGPGRYEKNLPDIHELVTTFGDEALAIKSAKRLLGIGEGRRLSPSQIDPGTTVHLLVAQLNGLLDD